MDPLVYLVAGSFCGALVFMFGFIAGQRSAERSLERAAQLRSRALGRP